MKPKFSWRISAVKASRAILSHIHCFEEVLW